MIASFNADRAVQIHKLSFSKGICSATLVDVLDDTRHDFSQLDFVAWGTFNHTPALLLAAVETGSFLVWTGAHAELLQVDTSCHSWRHSPLWLSDSTLLFADAQAINTVDLATNQTTTTKISTEVEYTESPLAALVSETCVALLFPEDNHIHYYQRKHSSRNWALTHQQPLPKPRMGETATFFQLKSSHKRIVVLSEYDSAFYWSWFPELLTQQSTSNYLSIPHPC
eukprot:m.301312 g.301312  ORF g.301312 m.301312 type:complete len:226 (+) comp14714_c0_seq1:559-1236(+)